MSIPQLNHADLDALLAAASADVPGVVAAVSIDGRLAYEGAAGVRRAGDATPMTTDTVLAIYSMTKAVTAAAAMCLVESGELDLDAPAGRYVDYLGEVPVLEGFSADGSPLLRRATTVLTLRHLLTHSSGFVYDMWNADAGRYAVAANVPNLRTQRKAALRMPLMFDPGTRWEYGIGIDWVGLIIEAVSGTTLGRYCEQKLFTPLGMDSTAFSPTPQQWARHAAIHVRLPNETAPLGPPDPASTDTGPAEFEGGGGGLHSTVGDYLKFAQMILDGGSANGVQVLRPETVATMAEGHLAEGLTVTPMTSANPMLTNDVDMHPGVPKTWGLSFLINEAPTVEGRPAGSLGWAGLANSYYWIDPVNRVCAVWATQLFPFFDKAAVDGFQRFEGAVYRQLHSGTA